MPDASEQSPPHEFPSWPMNYMAFYQHLAKDYVRYVQAVGKATDPAQAARAEGDYGVRVMNDMMQAWYDLALSPFTAMAKANAPPTSPKVRPDRPVPPKRAASKVG